jgi:RNA polymerase sigma-70 factor (ECF subfamily)
MPDGGHSSAASVSLGEFRRFYRQHYGFVWSTLGRLGVHAAVLDDATQDTFVAAHRRFDDGVRTPRAWLHGIARRVASNYRRTAGRNRRKAEAIGVVTSGPSRSPDHESILALREFLGRLRPGDRELFVLSELEGMSGREVAQALTVNMSTAYGRSQLLRRRFHEHMIDADPQVAIVAERRARPAASQRGWVALVGALTEPVGRGGVLAWMIAKTLVWAPAAALLTVVAVAQLTDSPAARVSVDLEPTRSPSTPAAELPIVTEAAVLPTMDGGVSASPPPIEAVAGAGAHAHPRPRAGAASIAREVALLREASEALATGDPPRALARLGAHLREFPDSAMADARAALRIEALCANGSIAQARGEAAVAARAFAGSVALARIQRSCAAVHIDR